MSARPISKSILTIITFLGIQILVLVRNGLSDYSFFFWFCDFAAVLYLISYLYGDEQIVKGIINFGFIPQAIFIGAFFLSLFFDISLFMEIDEGTRKTLFYAVSTLLIHSSSLLALIFTFKTKPNRNSLFYSAILIFAVYFIVLGYSDPESNFNYVRSASSMAFLPFDVPYYTYLWPILTFVLIILPTYSFQLWLYKLHKK